ncbi:MAG: hypothetical protein GXY86_15605 [Firmicutes bacterium]|jgi:hypothetical protein|nr:hypothetical protein [Bacillota bacterium]
MIFLKKPFIIGLLAGLILAYLSQYLFHIDGTRIYEAKKDIHLQNGSIITKGSRFVKYLNMPEGYSIFSMYVSVPNTDLNEKFDIKRDKRNFFTPAHPVIRD